MDKKQEEILLERIIDYFEQIAPQIVDESVASLATDHPIIDYYDTDFYIGKMAGHFDDIEESYLQKFVTDHIADINSVFFQYYQNARKPSKK